MHMLTNLHPFTVAVIEGDASDSDAVFEGATTTDHELVFCCEAEDAEHAREQAESAYPNGRIVAALQDDAPGQRWFVVGYDFDGSHPQLTLLSAIGFPTLASALRYAGGCFSGHQAFVVTASPGEPCSPALPEALIPHHGTYLVLGWDAPVNDAPGWRLLLGHRFHSHAAAIQCAKSKGGQFAPFVAVSV